MWGSLRLSIQGKGVTETNHNLKFQGQLRALKRIWIGFTNGPCEHIHFSSILNVLDFSCSPDPMTSGFYSHQ